MREKQGGIRLEKKFSTGNWMNSLWKVDEFALEIEAICTGNWMNLQWEILRDFIEDFFCWCPPCRKFLTNELQLHHQDSEQIPAWDNHS